MKTIPIKFAPIHTFTVDIKTAKECRSEIAWHNKRADRWKSCRGVSSWHRGIACALAGLKFNS